MDRQRAAKIDHYCQHLLDAYIGLRMNLALLQPLLPGAEDNVISRTASGGRSGILAIRLTLFNACILDACKLSWDRARRTPSIVNLMKQLDDPAVEAWCRDAATQYRLPRETANDLESEAGYQQFEEAERLKRSEAFDKSVRLLREDWSAFESSELKPRVRTLRDKFVAHLEVSAESGDYLPVDVKTLGLKWSDAGDLGNALAPIVWRLNMALRSADFQMSRAHESFARMGKDFWGAAF